MSQACTELAILDLAILIEMYGDDSRETLESALSGFAAAAPPYINAIKEAGTARELTTLASAAHSLKVLPPLPAPLSWRHYAGSWNRPPGMLTTRYSHLY
jgi:hypothetical protein